MRKTPKRSYNERATTISDLLTSVESEKSVNIAPHHCDVYFHGDDTIDSSGRTEGPFVLIFDEIDQGVGYRHFNLHHREPLFSSKAEKEVFNILTRLLGKNGEIGTSGRTTLVKLMWMIRRKAYNKMRPFDSMLKSRRPSKK